MKVALEYLDKKTQKKAKTFDVITRVAKFIGRSNDRTRSIGNKNSKFLLAHIADRINRSKNGVIFIDHEEISEITETRQKQNTNLMEQLTDIFEFEYHRFIRFEGERRCYGYKVNYTSDGIERINNPELFYPELFQKEFQIDSEKNYGTRGKKLPDVKQKITLHKVKNYEIHAQVQYNDLEDNKNIKDDLEDLPAGTYAYTHEEIPQEQDLQDQFKNDVSLQEAEVEVEVITDTKETTDNFETLTVGDTNYYHPVQKETTTEGIDLKRLAMRYFNSLAPKTEDNTEVEDIKPVITETATGNSIKEAVIAITSSTDNPSSSTAPQEATWMTIEQMREAMAKDRAKNQNFILNHNLEKEKLVITKTNSNGNYKNKLLREFKLTSDLFDAIRARSNKPHFSNDRIIAVVQNIVANKPETEIFGKRNAFINYMVNAINNEKEYTLEERGESIADRENQLAEEELYQFNNRIIIYGN